MNICMNIDNEERKQITNSKELVDYILENANDEGKCRMKNARKWMLR